MRVLQNAVAEPVYDHATMNEDDGEEEVELPPPMKPLSESLLTKDETQQQVGVTRIIYLSSPNIVRFARVCGSRGLARTFSCPVISFATSGVALLWDVWW